MLRLLLVDDDQMHGKDLQQALQGLPVQVVGEAGGLAEAMGVVQRTLPRRLPVVHGEKTLLLDPVEIFFAFALDEQVYLKTAHGRLACQYTLRELEERLAPFGFLRTHRRYLADVSRVREVHHYFKGAMGLIMEDAEHSEVPVSRNLAPEVRRRLGL
ncbi:MAG: LytTR family transcriptional regulator DNA-binding domain-containing protein [Mycobacterium leprae]